MVVKTLYIVVKIKNSFPAFYFYNGDQLVIYEKQTSTRALVKFPWLHLYWQ